jgi:hypothetical protein
MKMGVIIGTFQTGMRWIVIVGRICMGVGSETGFDRRCQPELHVHGPMSLGILHTYERGMILLFYLEGVYQLFEI